MLIASRSALAKASSAFDLRVERHLLAVERRLTGVVLLLCGAK